MPTDTLNAPAPALAGTFDHLGVRELLEFLGATGASGRLEVAGELAVTLWWDGGALVAGDSDAELPFDDALDARRDLGDHPDIARRTLIAERRLDAVFQLLVLGDASFAFYRDDPLPEGWEGCTTPIGVDALLAEAEVRIERWRVVAATIPSASVVVRLAPSLPSGVGSVEIGAEEFPLLSLLDGRRTLAEITADVGASAFEVCERVHGLVVRGVAVVGV